MSTITRPTSGPIVQAPVSNPFELTDVGDAIKRYLDHDVVVTLGEIDPAVTSSLEPGELGTFTVHVQNGPIALENVSLHLTLENDARADFQVPPSAAIVTSASLNGSQLPRNSFVNAMFVRLLNGDLDADGTIDLTLTITAGAVGASDIRAHVHGDVPLSSLLPTAKRSSPDVTTEVVVE